MSNRTSRNGMRILIAALLGAAAGSGWAADAETTSCSNPGGRAMEEVVVTAAKRAQNPFGIVRASTPQGGDFVNYIQPRTLMLRLSGRF